MTSRFALFRFLPLALGVAALLPTLPSLAADSGAAQAAPAFTTSANVGIYSQYVFRGLTQTNEKPALQGGFDISHESGLYAGVWASNISWISDANPAASASLEADIYAGFKYPFNDTLTGDVGVLHYAYPGSFPDGYTKADTNELYLGLDAKWISLRYSYSVGNTFGSPDTHGSTYIDLSATHELFAGINGIAHVGRQHYTGSNSSNLSYTDWKLGLTRDFSGYVLGAFYTDTNANAAGYTVKGKNLGRDQLVLSVSHTF
ncbi:TorF family putative porin [Herbaspirillum sp. RV1423]|uniref:TorF family putative porin n=1 Tax=Herbaspirillum sp. RV1423 TaxID=1443993 RepID=UPI0004B85327|nr:TorF family putative porin [Herbaspirillum sp. RV1423]